MATETQTPIEALRRRAIAAHAMTLAHDGDFAECEHLGCAAARRALEDVGAVVREAKALQDIIAESEGVAGWHLNGAVAPWGEFECVDGLGAALAKFQVKP